MKIEINDTNPDGLSVVFKEPFIFDTLDDVTEFIKKVEKDYIDVNYTG